MENHAFYNVSVAGKVIPAALILFRYHLVSLDTRIFIRKGGMTP